MIAIQTACPSSRLWSAQAYPSRRRPALVVGNAVIPLSRPQVEYWFCSSCGYSGAGARRGEKILERKPRYYIVEDSGYTTYKPP